MQYFLTLVDNLILAWTFTSIDNLILAWTFVAANRRPSWLAVKAGGWKRMEKVFFLFFIFFIFHLGQGCQRQLTRKYRLFSSGIIECFWITRFPAGKRLWEAWWEREGVGRWKRRRALLFNVGALLRGLERQRTWQQVGRDWNPQIYSSPFWSCAFNFDGGVRSMKYEVWMEGKERSFDTASISGLHPCEWVSKLVCRVSKWMHYMNPKSCDR